MNRDFDLRTVGQSAMSLGGGIFVLKPPLLIGIYGFLLTNEKITEWVSLEKKLNPCQNIAPGLA